MSRLALALIALPACGRLAFDPHAFGGDGGNGGDSAMPSDAIDGPPACGGGWCVESTPVTDDLAAIFGVAPADLWAVGGGGTILHRDGASWSRATSNVSVNLVSIWGATANDIWAAGDDGAAHWNGSAWSPASVAGGASVVTSLWGFSANDIWAAGKLPNMISHYTGGAAGWMPVMLPPGNAPEYQVVFGAAPNDVWIGGHDGTLYRNTGAGFVATPLATGRSIYSMHGLATNDIWIGASFGTTFHFDGTSWTEIGAPVTVDLGAILEISPTEVYAAGGDGTVIRWNGSAWSVVPTNSPRFLSGMWAVGGELRVVGSIGTVLRKP